MNLYLRFSPEYDSYIFSDCNLSNAIQLRVIFGSNYLLDGIQSSLQQNRKVIIVNNERDLDEINIELLKSFHFFSNDKIIFLNISLKNKINKIKDSNKIFSSFQQFEFFLSNSLK